jgi:signal transduction histidine kinase
VQLGLRSTPNTRGAGAAAIVALASGVLALVTLIALRTVHTAPELGYVVWSPSGAAALLVPGLAAIGVALEALHRRPEDRSALLLALAGLASLLPELSIPGTRPALVFTAGLVLAWATPPLVGHLALVYPASATTVGVRALCAAGYVSAIFLLGLLSALVFDRIEAGCSQCAANLVLLHTSTRLEAPLTQAGIASALTWATLCVAAIALRLVRATPAARRLLWPVLVPAAVLVGCFAVELALSMQRAFLSTGSVDRKLWLGGQLALLALVVGMASRRLRARRARALLARDVIELSNRSSAETLAHRLSVVLGDPTLEVAYPVGEPTRFVDAHGTPVDLKAQPGRATTALRGLDGARQPVAVLRHREGLLDDVVLVEEIARAARLPLANERLRADAQARLALLQASRKRIVAAADAERQRIERDLHDGAQQRLVSLAVALRATGSAEGREWPLLDEAQQEVASALHELRLIARGIYPAVLDEMGLAAAIEALAETAPLPVKIGDLPQERLDPVVEATAYFVCAVAVHNPEASRVTISGHRNSDTLNLAVTTDAPTHDVTRLSDRVGAAGGAIRRRSMTDRVLLEAEIPCGS